MMNLECFSWMMISIAFKIAIEASAVNIEQLGDS
jgi:hypothetical protein